MGFWKDFFNIREVDETKSESEDLFKEFFGVAKDKVDENDALEIPIVNACISRISDVIASTKLNLYKRTDNGIEHVVKDDRVKLLNTKVDNGTLNSFELKKLIVRDYFLKGYCYFYIKRKGNKVIDISYTKDISISVNDDPFNKIYDINVQNRRLKPHNFFKVVRNSNNGIKGKSIIEETGLHLLLIINTMDKMLKDINRGFIPKGFFKLESNVKNLNEVKKGIAKMMNDNSVGYAVLNSGISFEPIEKKKDAEKEAKANTTEINRIASMFGVPVPIIQGGGSEEDKFNFINFTILPLLSTIEASLNRDLLLEQEQEKYYFAFETKELLKGNIYERFKAYEVAIKNNILSMDDVRDLENMPRLNFGFYKFNIADAMYYYDKEKDINMLLNVNTNTVIDINKVLESSNETGILNINKENEEVVIDDKDFEEKNKENEDPMKGGEEDESKSL